MSCCALSSTNKWNSTSASVSSKLQEGPSPSLATLSFTERLAAKKASRNKSNEGKANQQVKSEQVVLGASKSNDVVGASERKRVQFSLGSMTLNYTPEGSDENAAIHKDEGVDSYSLQRSGERHQLPSGDSETDSPPPPPSMFDEKNWKVTKTDLPSAILKLFFEFLQNGNQSK